MLNDNSRIHYSGFSLLELIIATAIVVLVAGGGIAGFVSFTDRQEVLNTALEVQQLMRTAQSKARVRDVPDLCDATPLTSYQVTVESSSIALVAVCGSSQTIKTYTFPNGVTIIPQQSIKFATLDQLVTKPDGSQLPGDPPLITYTISKGTYSFAFTVSSTGAISKL